MLQIGRLPINGILSVDSSFDSPSVWEVPAIGGFREKRYYLSMQDPVNEGCTDGVLYAFDSTEPDQSSWFQFASDEGGVPGEYSSEFNFEIGLAEVVPVWVRVSVPSGLEEKPKTDVSLAMSYIRYEVGE